MRRHLTLGAILLVAAGVSHDASAMPAKQGVMSVQMSDGTELNVTLRGDEFYHQYFTEDGYPLVERDGRFYYCDINPDGSVLDSNIPARNAGARTAAEASFLGSIRMNGLEERIRNRASLAMEACGVSAQPLLRAPESGENGDVQGPPYEMGYGLFPKSRGPIFPS